jgi:hypothetical protein
MISGPGEDEVANEQCTQQSYRISKQLPPFVFNEQEQAIEGRPKEGEDQEVVLG